MHSNISTSMQRIMIRKEHRIRITHVEEVASVLGVSIDHVCKAIDSIHVIGTTREEKIAIAWNELTYPNSIEDQTLYNKLPSQRLHDKRQRQQDKMCRHPQTAKVIVTDQEGEEKNDSEAF